jgi:hypothetical protein
MAIVPISNLNADTPKSKLFELLGISKDASVDKKLFDLLVEKLEELGIQEEGLSDGYEFMGGSRSLNNYINKNAATLVTLMSGVLDAEDEAEKKPEQEKDPDKILEKNEDGFLIEQSDDIEAKEKPVKTEISSASDIYTVGVYYSTPMILSKTTEFFDRGSAKINGFNVVTPFKLEKLGRVLEAITKAKTGLLSPKAMFEIRAYYFEKVISDTTREIFGGSSYFLIGFYDKINLNGRETDFSFLFGKTHFNSIGFVLTNSTQIPIRLGKSGAKVYLISKVNLLHKYEDEYTGWVDIGLSLRYDINTSKISKGKGLIKRRQTIIE